jgi:ribosomal protein S18 acetylase RimI-like enzyme
MSFMHPLLSERADAFLLGLVDDVKNNKRILLVAENASGAIVGTVQVVLNQPANQPHRADILKMLVHQNVRRQGLAEALMSAAEKAAAQVGKTLLVLDAEASGDAERLYVKRCWLESGKIPDYALFPRGGLCSTTIFYKGNAF